ncbi:LPS export ABC transporter periplasmic protein LptC [bacterium]|nr:LPS export ABC transporter periplasmic protein LptC [bacterium]
MRQSRLHEKNTRRGGRIVSILPCKTTKMSIEMKYSLIIKLFCLSSFSISTVNICGCQKINEPPEAYELTKGMPDQEIWNARIEFTQGDRITSILNAKYMAIYEQPGLTLVDTFLRLDMFDNSGRHTSVITADSGVIRGEDSLLAIGNVVVISDSGLMLETERLGWNRNSAKVISDTNIVLTTETDTLYGVGLIADEDLKNWEILKPRGKTIRKIEKKERPPEKRRKK